MCHGQAPPRPTPSTQHFHQMDYWMTISSNVYKDEDDIMAQLIVYHRHASIIIGIKTQAGIINIYIYTYLEPI